MGRYVTGGILAAIVFGTLMGAVNGESIVQQLTQVLQGSREAISATPATANTAPDSGLTPVESAGQAVQRQGDAANGTLTQGDNAAGDAPVPEATTPTPTEPISPTAPAPAATTPTGSGSPIPALW